MVKKINSDSNKILNQLFSSFSHGLKPIMVKYFDTLDELLYELAEKTDSDIEKKFYFESMRSIRVHKLNVLVSYLKTIQHVFEMFFKKDFVYFKELYSYHQNKSIPLSLKANDIDEIMIQNSLIYKFESKHQKQLEVTTSYFSSIIENDLEQQHNPISPFVLVSTFAKSIRLLHLDQNIKVILYKHYELNIMAKTGSMYKQSIAYLSSKIANSLLAKSRELPAEKTSSKNYTITKSEINKVLCDLQSKCHNNISETPHAIKTALMAQLEHIQLTQSHHINNHDLYSIDSVCMRFQLLADNQNIHDSIKKIIFKLQIPYLKFLTKDDTFIENKKHPAQLLLDVIHSSSIGWSEERDNNHVFIKQLDSLVSIIIKSQSLNEHLFNVIYKDYQVFINQQENEFALEQKRIKSREQGKAKIVAAMQTVDALIDFKTENISLPAFINDILFGPWRSLLSLLLVRYSDTSDAYLKMVVFIDDLIGLINSDQYEIIIEDHIKKLCKVYKEGLGLVAYNGDVLDGKIKSFNDNLMKYHSLGDFARDKIPDSVNINSNEIKTKRYARIPKDIKATKDRLLETKAPNLQGFNKKDSMLLKTVPIGTWVEIPRSNKNPVKAQLSWINPKSGKFIFVNARGLKVTDKSPSELLVDLKDNRIIVCRGLI